QPKKASGPYRLIPYGRNSTFTGRRELLELVKRVSESNAHNRIALHGLGGSGKTEIALEYVYQRASESDCHIFWVQGSGLLKFTEGLRDVAQHVRIPPPGTETDGEGFLLSIRRWLEGPNSGSWILVVDNADNDADFAGNSSPIAKFIPQGTKGTVILTTRSRRVASRQGCKMIEVGRMEEEDAQELFSKRIGSMDSPESKEKKAITMILASVDHLPLAIIGAAAFMIETNTPPSAYSTIFQENDERAKELLSQHFCDIRREIDVTESIIGTYFATFDRITQQMPAAANLLRLMALFDRQNIPEELLSQSGLEGMDDPVEFRRAIGKLLGFSLVTVVKCEEKPFYELHRLVHLSLQVYLSTEDLNRERAIAVSTVSRFLKRHENERQGVYPVYVPHAVAVTKDSTGPIAEELGFRVGQYLLDTGSYNGAEIFRELLEGIEKSLGPYNSDVLQCILCLALALRRQGKYDESEKLNRRAVEGYEKVLGPEHPDTLTGADNLALLLQDQGKYNESEKMNRQVLERREKILGLDHPHTLTSANNLALALRGQGRYGESEEMNRRALEGYEKVFRPDHPDVLTCTENLALVLRHQGKYDESEAMAQRALEQCEKVLGLEHPDTLRSVSNLASILHFRNKHNESEVMNRRAMEGCEKILGPDHPDTLTSAGSLALVLQNQGKYYESEMMNRRVLQGYEKVLGSYHPSTLSSFNNLGVLLQFQRKYAESETVNRRALEGYKKVLGPDHPNTLTS
ncbi:unnamed protein product, partial [Tuber aestivum]